MKPEMGKFDGGVHGLPDPCCERDRHRRGLELIVLQVIDVRFDQNAPRPLRASIITEERVRGECGAGPQHDDSR
jgi:hypothetical protein